MNVCYCDKISSAYFFGLPHLSDFVPIDLHDKRKLSNEHNWRSAFHKRISFPLSELTVSSSGRLNDKTEAEKISETLVSV